MWKICFKLFIILLCVITVDSVQAKAYTVTVKEDSIYSEVIPESFVQNAPAIFKKNVKKAMKYYNKYKNADPVTYMRTIPDMYRDFIEIARKIHDSDEIVIHSPFYPYDVGVDDEEEGTPFYNFLAEKNGKRLCIFSLYIDDKSKKLTFGYSKMTQYFIYDSKTTKNALFYWLGEKCYAETPDKTICIRNLEVSGRIKMQTDGVDWDAILKKRYKEFQKQTYDEKKDEIFNYIKKSQKKKVIKKVEKNMKLELKNDYVETASNPEVYAETSNFGRVYMVIGIICVIALVAGILLVRKRRREQ